MKNKIEVNPVVIILGLVGALIIGIVTGAIWVGKFLINKLKQKMKELRAVHKEDIKSIKEDSEKHINSKNEIIKKQQRIIDELLELFLIKDKKEKCIADTPLGQSIYKKIVKQRDKLN